MAFRNKFLKQSDCASSNRYLKESDTDNNFRYLNTAARECNAPLGEGTPDGPTGPPVADGNAAGLSAALSACTDSPQYMRDALITLCNELSAAGNPISMFAPICQDSMKVDLFNGSRFDGFGQPTYDVQRGSDYSTGGTQQNNLYDEEGEIIDYPNLGLFVYLSDLPNVNRNYELTYFPVFDTGQNGNIVLRIRRERDESGEGGEGGSTYRTLFIAETQDVNGVSYREGRGASNGNDDHATIVQGTVNGPIIVKLSVDSDSNRVDLSLITPSNNRDSVSTSSGPASDTGDGRPDTDGIYGTQLFYNNANESAGVSLALMGQFPGEDTSVQASIIKFHNAARRNQTVQ